MQKWHDIAGLVLAVRAIAVVVAAVATALATALGDATLLGAAGLAAVAALPESSFK